MSIFLVNVNAQNLKGSLELALRMFIFVMAGRSIQENDAIENSYKFLWIENSKRECCELERGEFLRG